MTTTKAARAPTGRQALAPGCLTGRSPAPPARPARPAGAGGTPGTTTLPAPRVRRAGPSRPVLYFAYGSNMDRAQMRRRCPTAAPIGPATLDGWRLAFGGHSRTWGGSVATLVRGRNSRVDGLLYTLAPTELRVLDLYEGHPGCYQRRCVTVTFQPGGRRRKAHTYVLPIALEEPPALGYLAVLWRAYRALGLDHQPLLAAAVGGVS
ncbi:MAG: gamma-glutamylcyclotransferase family protein [bacterium]